MEQLPLSCDAHVLTPEQLKELLDRGSRMAIKLQRDLRWLLFPPGLKSVPIGIQVPLSWSQRSRTKYKGRPFTSSNTRPRYSPNTPNPISWIPPKNNTAVISEA